VRCEVNFIFDPSLVLYLPLHVLDGASFASRDAYGHACTVTGALWGPNGHYFDGDDDYIACGTNSALLPTTSLTIEVWFKITGNTGALKVLASRSYTVVEFRIHTDEHLSFQANRNGGNLYAEGGTALGVNDFYHGVFVFDTVNQTANSEYHGMYLNGELETLSWLGGADTNTALQSTATALDLGHRTGGAFWFEGNIGEVRVYNRALTQLEIQHNYLATKWRYR